MTKTHNLSGTSLHKTWLRIRRRCNSPQYHNYPRYGARGIKVCERWDVFENFVADMGEKPTPQHTIERINNDGDYEPSNCRWATCAKQNRNKSNTYTAEEDQKIREAVAMGCSFPQIAKHVGKPEGSVTMRAYRLGLKSGRPPIPRGANGPYQQQPKPDENLSHPMRALWREIGLPEYFFGNDGFDVKLYELYDAIVETVAPTGPLSPQDGSGA